MQDEIAGQEALFALSDTDREEQKSQLEDAVAQARAGNAGRMSELRGLNRKMDPGNVALVRLDCIVEVLFGADEISRLQFEKLFEERMAEVLDQAVTSVRRAHLTGPSPNGLFLKP